MLEKIIDFLSKSMSTAFGIYENKLKSVVTRVKNLSLVLGKYIRKAFHSFVNYVFGQPTSVKDYVHLGQMLISKQIFLRSILIVAAVIFFLTQYAYPYLEGKLWRASLVINTEKCEDFTGKAKIYTKNGELLYIGDLEGGKAKGEAELYEDEQLVYKGEMRSNKYNGEGSLYENGKLLYEGSFLNNHFAGDGVLYHTNGTVKFRGTFLDNECLEGIAYYNNGRLQYQGTYLNGKYSGEGISYSNNEQNSIRYTGNFLNGLYEGEGKLFAADQTLLYEGTFRSGQYHGEGKLYHMKTGRLEYEGNFLDGKFHGEGKLYGTSGKKLYQGNFIDNEIDYVSLIGVGVEELREILGKENSLYMLENSFLLLYDSLHIAFAFHFADEDTMTAPSVQKILFLGDQKVNGIQKGMSLADVQKTMNEEDFYNAYGFRIYEEDRFFYYLAGAEMEQDENGFVARYIVQDEVYWNVYSDVSDGKVLYFEMGAV